MHVCRIIRNGDNEICKKKCNPHILVTFLCSRDKIFDKKQLEKGRITFAHSVRVQSIMLGKS